MDIKFTIDQFDNGITLRAEGTAIVIPDHSVNMEVGRIIMENVKTVMDAHSENKVTLSIKIESDEQQ